jgi:hypothetical protein
MNLIDNYKFVKINNSFKSLNIKELFPICIKELMIDRRNNDPNRKSMENNFRICGLKLNVRNWRKTTLKNKLK